MRKIVVLIIMVVCLDIGLYAQSKFGITVGLQPALRNQIEQTATEQVSDFPIYFMKHFTAGVFFRQSCTKHIYLQMDVNASLDADWGYISDGEDFWDEFGRAFEKPNKIHVDIPIYIGVYVLKSDAFKLRVFGCPQYSMRANTAFNFSSITWNNFTLNVGVGVDLLSFITFNVNYRLPFNYGDVSFNQSKFSATIGLML